ncbi:Proteasome, subunit alpha/beta [Metarhizium album ARSEF 1941]|uniref:Proteasome, subunit alpha/beta n=1 Tax=Metarhizium album (strain ARSEF 1941) TaxID=1081103 RepID=A0A0B2WM98_METAS|nr:Proteasome, subunit alpha/beta [Metarhizium album ARSEF 1941]KHN94145.1 Proteasome, subunit alpha/beta [Metarhizium album ARSEF 1941]
MFLCKALVFLVGAAAAVHGLVVRQTGGGQSYPDCDGLQRIESVPDHMNSGDKLFRSSAPYYLHEDSDQRITEETIRCLRQLGITHVISLNGEADNQAIRQALQDQGIAYTALATPDFHAPTVNQLQQGWDAFYGHRQGTLVWCGYGWGRTGTMITALQMYAQAERGETLRWTREQYHNENRVEADNQLDRLDQLQEHLRHRQPPFRDETVPMKVDEPLVQRVRDGDFNGVDCPQVLDLALALSLLSISDRTPRRRALPGEECKQAQELFLREQCGVSDYSRPSAINLTSGSVHVFSRNGQGNLVETAWENGQWWPYWIRRDGYIASQPAAMVINDNALRVYARSGSNELVEGALNDGAWQSWKGLGGEIASAPTAIWLGESLGVRVYARNKANHLVEITYSGGRWSDWENLGGDIVGDPSALWMGDDVGIRVYARNRAGELMEKAYQSGRWHEWKNLGGSISSSPAAIALAPGDVRIYARNYQYELVEQGTRGGNWQNSWSGLGGGKFTGSPGAIWMGDRGILKCPRGVRHRSSQHPETTTRMPFPPSMSCRRSATRTRQLISAVKAAPVSSDQTQSRRRTSVSTTKSEVSRIPKSRLHADGSKSSAARPRESPPGGATAPANQRPPPPQSSQLPPRQSGRCLASCRTQLVRPLSYHQPRLTIRRHTQPGSFHKHRHEPPVKASPAKKLDRSISPPPERLLGSQSLTQQHNVVALLHQFVIPPSLRAPGLPVPRTLPPVLTTLFPQKDGGACVAMVGKDCVAIACDLRLGLQALTVSNNFPKIFQYGDVFLGLTGLATDVSTVADLFRYKVNMYRLREERAIAPRTFANLVSSSLYERRFGPYFVSPVVAGLDPKTGKPFICGFDSIGCIDFAKDFIVSGTASEQLFGMCEGLWEEDMGPDALFETISQALLNAVDRDALSGWGAHVYIIEKDKVTKRLLKGRQD